MGGDGMGSKWMRDPAVPKDEEDVEGHGGPGSKMPRESYGGTNQPRESYGGGQPRADGGDDDVEGHGGGPVRPRGE
jgi:hypothetical protein